MGGNNSKQGDSLGDSEYESKQQIECSEPTRVPSVNDVNPPSNGTKDFDEINLPLIKDKEESSEINQRLSGSTERKKEIPLSNDCGDERKGSNNDYNSLDRLNQNTERETERYQKVFKAYYARLCDCIPVEEILPHLVSNETITVREMDDILVEKTAFRQAHALLNGPIWRAISGGCPKVFIAFLCALNSVRNCETLCEKICSDLNVSTEVIANESREFLTKCVLIAVF